MTLGLVQIWLKEMREMSYELAAACLSVCIRCQQPTTIPICSARYVLIVGCWSGLIQAPMGTPPEAMGALAQVSRAPPSDHMHCTVIPVQCWGYFWCMN